MPPDLDYATMSSDIIMKGNLKKAKNWKKRYFVLHDGSPAKLEYYESERKWKNNNSKPKRRISLENPWNISKKKDSRHEFLIVIFTEDEYFSMAADNAETQEQWITALQQAVKPEPGSVLFDHMWHVILDNKELEGCKNSLLVSLQGPHRVCLTHDQMVFVRTNSSGGGDRAKRDPVEIRITSIRVFGHKEGMFFIVPGRASGIGSGKLWMDLNDAAMAGNMHQTILQIMYALNQEEANGYRGRTNSSGSNSSRTRRSVVSVRSHYNNPPPSQIGMGKMASSVSESSDRIRCDSLPAPKVGALNDSRLRTGSEGENTMRRPSRVNSMRYSSGSSSPGIRSRFWISHNRRGTSHCPHRHNNSHSYTTSLSSSCNGSSTTSSCEHLNMGLNTSGDVLPAGNGVLTHLPPSMSSPAVNERILTDDCVDRHSPTQSYLQITGRKGSVSRNYKSNGSSHRRSPTPELLHQSSIPPLIRENCEANRHYCTACLAHIPYSQTRNESQGWSLNPCDLAPPPPDIDPPSNPHHNNSSSSHEYTNVLAHCRSQSMEDGCLSGGIAASSLSASPLLQNGFHPNISNKTHPAANPFPQEQETKSVSHDDYTPMAYDGRSGYPHQEVSQQSFHKMSNCNSSIIDKLVSSSSASFSSPTSEYTPMTVNLQMTTSPPIESTAQTKCQSGMFCGYVAMRSLNEKLSLQDIGNRRRSVPDATPRNPESNQFRSSAPPSYSTDKSSDVMNTARNFCQECCEHFSPQKNPEVTLNSKTSPSVSSANSQPTNDTELNDDRTKDRTKPGSTSEYLTPDVQETSITPPSPTTKADDEYLCMQPLQQEVRDMKLKKAEAADMPQSSTSSFLVETNANYKAPETNGYLLMNPACAGALSSYPVRKTLVSSILSVAEPRGQAPSVATQYPHQKRHDFSTNSLDRPRKSSFRTKRTLSLGFRHTLSSARRSQSLKQSKKNSNNHSPSSSTPPAPPTSRTSLSPEDEYVNIDFSKAQSQSQSPYVLKVTKSKDDFYSSRLPSVRTALPEADYTEMNFKPIAKCSIRANT